MLVQLRPKLSEKHLIHAVANKESEKPHIYVYSNKWPII